MATAGPRVRRSLADIQADYDRGDKAELEALMRAWHGIKALPPSDPRSFFTLGGFHGEPFRGPGETDPTWWGGYCQHGTVLFPTWHRAYLFKLEEALRSIPGCADVTLPFWDECSDESLAKGIPSALTDEFFMLDGVQIDNPLRSFVFPVDIVDQVNNDGALYSKPAGYETKRFPLSGLVGTPEAQAASAKHNAQFPDHGKNTVLLNQCITTWLNFAFQIDGRSRGEIHTKFIACLDAPNYTLFSNTTSMGNWNANNPANKIMAIESPHNFMHLAIGGYDVSGNPNPNNNADSSLIAGANGDMGENDTAGLDPIFFFHHCFIDYVFWTWQKRNGATGAISIDPNDPGAKYDPQNNPPPAGAEPTDVMSMQTALNPFMAADGVTPMTSADCVDIEKQLGYTFGPGSLDPFASKAEPTELKALAGSPGRTVHIAGIDRSKIRGSFIVTAVVEHDGQWHVLGHEPVLSRWQIAGCANCQTRLKVSADFNLPDLPTSALTALAESTEEAPTVHIALRTRAGTYTHRIGGASAQAFVAESASLAEAQPLFSAEIR